MENYKRGVFWLIDGELLAVPFDENATFGIAKSGDNVAAMTHRLAYGS